MTNTSATTMVSYTEYMCIDMYFSCKDLLLIFEDKKEKKALFHQKIESSFFLLNPKSLAKLFNF